MNTSTGSTLATLATAEQCDRCTARARVSTTFLVGDRLCDLLWCGHHFSVYETKIRRTAVFLQDQRYPVGLEPA